jgi:GAF domain-containing protein
MGASDTSRLLEILHETALRLNRHHAIEQLLHDVVDLALEAVNGDSCLIYLYDHYSNDLVLRASSNAHPDELGRLHIAWGEGITGWVAQQRRAVAIAKDAANDPRFKFYTNLPEDRYEAFLSVPVLNRNTVLGVINLQHCEGHHHDEGEIKTVTAMALMLGEALDREVVEKRSAEAKRQLEVCARLSDLSGETDFKSEALAREVAGAVGAGRCQILLAPNETGPANGAAQQFKDYAQLACDARGTFTAPTGDIVAPICRGEEIHGFICCAYARDAEATPDRLRVLGTIARSLGLASHAAALEKRCVEYEASLAARKVIERAKGILQRERNISEDEAYRLLQRESRKNRRAMVTVAQALLTSRALSESTTGQHSGT